MALANFFSDFFASFRNLSVADSAIYIAIALITLTGFVKCLLPVWNTTRSLRRAIRHLESDSEHATGEKPVWQESRFVGKKLRGSWLRFLQNAEQLDRRGLPCNVEDYINDDTVTHIPGNAALAELIPSLLTSLGFLGTLMGMMRGLGGLDMSDTSVLIEKGIPALLSGMQFAFGTSVAGVTCSLTFNMLNRITQGSSYRAIDSFTTAFTQLAMQRPLDNDVQLICQNQDCNHILATACDTLPSKMAVTIESSLSRAMQPVTRSMDNFLIGATRNQIEGVDRIVQLFMDKMNASLSGQFLLLGQTLSDLNQHQQLTCQQAENSLQSAQKVLTDVARLQGISQEILTGFEAYWKEMSAARRRDEQFESSSAALLEQMRSAAATQQSALKSLMDKQNELSRAMEQFQKSSTTALERVTQSDRTHQDAMQKAGDTMRSATEELSRNYSTFVKQVVEGVSRSLGLFDSSMREMTDVFSAKVERLDQALSGSLDAAQISEIQRLLSSIEQSIQRAADTLDAVKEG